jgi:glc operon protein GlcG
MLREATKTPNRPLAIAICDDQGELVTFARMDRCAPQPPVVARKKAYTAARTRTDTKVYADRLKSQGRSVTEFGDPNLLAAQGGGGDHESRGSERARGNRGERAHGGGG